MNVYRSRQKCFASQIWLAPDQPIKGRENADRYCWLASWPFEVNFKTDWLKQQSLYRCTLASTTESQGPGQLRLAWFHLPGIGLDENKLSAT